MLRSKLPFAIITAAVIIVGSIAVVLLNCSPIYNQPKLQDFEAVKYDISDAKQDDQSLIFASFSGGGSRAACMCWEALKQFKQISYSYMDKDSNVIKSNLAEQIDYISGISGGSFAAAAWCLFKDSMEVFDERFVNKSIQGAIIRRFLFSHRFFQAISPNYNRINIAAEYYDENVFNSTSFSQLHNYPVLWINATHLALGLRFTYTQDYFDFLESDIKDYPIGYACAASSAFPILLDPITLWNYGETQEDSVLLKNTKYRMAKKNSHRDWERYFYTKKVEFFNNKKNRWNHMADGGLVDNQGLQVILDQFQTNGIINKRINNAKINPLKRLVFINVNAGVSSNDKSCQSQSPPHVPSVMKYTMTISMDRLSAKRWEEIKLRSRDKKKLMEFKGYEFERPYFIELSFRNLRNDSLRNECMNLPTSFKLKEKQRKLIRKTVPVLVKENRDLSRLMRHVSYEDITD